MIRRNPAVREGGRILREKKRGAANIRKSTFTETKLKGDPEEKVVGENGTRTERYWGV